MLVYCQKVAPLAGAWIEIPLSVSKTASKSVAPLAGAWIEIVKLYVYLCVLLSLLSRERGLKSGEWQTLKKR